MTIGLYKASLGFKPFSYPWAYDYWLLQQQMHWVPQEVPLSEDVKDWTHKLTAEEKNLLTQIFRFFTQSDIDVNNNYMDNYSRIFKPTEVRMMLSAFSNIETVHIAAYALLMETIGMPEREYAAFMEYEQMRDKHNYLSYHNVDNVENTLLTLAVFGAFTEGLQLFASFAMLLNFPRFGKMKGMGQIITWSVRDESLHCEGIIRLFHALARESGLLSPTLQEKIRMHCGHVVEMEDRFIDLAFSLGEVPGMTAEDIKLYIRFVANWRLSQLKLEPLYPEITAHPLPWLKSMLNGVEHANFFETRPTEYSKAATKGSWDKTWEYFDLTKV